jgi:segregation and condensation protein A
MTEAFQPNLDFTAVEQIDAGEAFVVDLEGYEGPLHVLLALARTQKVDLLKLSITKLAEQYLAFVHEARRRNFSLAADYLVMASWLAYLKSRLLLPRTDKGKGDEPPAEDMAAALAFRLQKLEAMRKAVEAIQARPQLKRDVFTRGDPEATVIVPSDRIDASLYELMSAYVIQRRREQARHYTPGQRVEAFALEAARDWLRDVLPRLSDWTPLEQVAPLHGEGDEGPSQASFTASTLSASLELVKEGAMDVRQKAAFEEIYLKRRAGGPGLGQPLELNP